MPWETERIVWFALLWYFLYCGGLERTRYVFEVCLYFSLCMSLCVYVSVSLSMPLGWPVCLSTCVCLCLCVCLCMSLSLGLSLGLCLSGCLCLCVSVILCQRVSLSHSPGVNGLPQELLSGGVGWAVLMPHLVLTSAKMLQADKNTRCTSKPHTANRFPHGCMTPVTRAGEGEEEERAGSFGIMFTLGLAFSIPPIPWQTTHTSLILHYFHPHPSPWDISRILNAYCDVLLCRNDSSWELLLQLPLIFMCSVQCCKGEEMRKCGWWLRKLRKYPLLCLEFSSWVFKNWPRAVPALIFWLLSFLWPLSFHFFLAFVLRVPSFPNLFEVTGNSLYWNVALQLFAYC